MLAMKFPLFALAGCAAALLCGCPKPRAAAPADASSAEGCVDAWLEAHGRDRYGNARGTMYAGGSPLFDERTGVATDRLSYVFEHQPLARAACAPDGG